MLQTYLYDKSFQLESGQFLDSLTIAYHTYGQLNEKKDNVIWVCHALTANSNVFDWWQGLFGENELFNPHDYFIICANNLGSCYGTTGPVNENRKSLYAYFPHLTIRDLVNAHELLRNYLGIENIAVLIGGSQGGQQALEWSIMQSGIVQQLILVATNAKHSAWGIAFNESQRLAIKADRTYYGNAPDGGQKGLAAARSIALLSYRNYEPYNSTQQEVSDDKVNDFNAASYQRYQGEKLVKRFNAYSYITLANAMDSHNVGRGRISTEEALAKVSAQTLIIGISSDLLFPPTEQKFLAKHIPNAQLEIIDSAYGHDGFLIETKKLTQGIGEFIKHSSPNLQHNQMLVL
jgi:homoserine O-acetyltransferase/O-succinyltransferase